MISPFDAWAVAALLAGCELNGGLSAVSDRFRRIADRLAGMPLIDRLGAWNAFLDGCADRAAIETTLFQVDPTSRPPEPDGSGDDEPADDWEPIRLGALPPAAPFPLDVLPLPARELAEAAAKSIACPVDFVAVAILAAASGIIGRSACLRIKAGYFASASLYAALVGSPSSGKSPALRAAMAPLWFIATMLYDVWRSTMDAWEQTDPKARGEPPELDRLVSTDPTTEALAPILSKNPRGLTLCPDEMTK